MTVSGVFAALTTPYAHDGTVCLPDLKQNVHRYNHTDLAGYVALGSTGESVLLTRAEMDRILVAVKEEAAKGKTLLGPVRSRQQKPLNAQSGRQSWGMMRRW